MKIDKTTITITRIEKATDKDGFAFLKCKGYNLYKHIYNNKRLNAYNLFTTIRLYPRNEEQMQETIKRLFEQTNEKPKIKIITEEAEIFTNLIGKDLRVFLNVNKYDFEKNKMFTKTGKRRDIK